MSTSSFTRKTGLAWIVLALGLLVSVVGGLQVKHGIEQDAARQFGYRCDQVALKIGERLGAYALILRGGAALFAAWHTVDRDEWRAYVETLRASGSVPGVQGIGFAQVIAPDQLAAHVAGIRGEGFPEYSVRPPGERALYTSIVFLEPFRDRNLRAFGFDMYAEPVRRAAMDQARDTGEAALSGKVQLVQETGTQVQAGTLMYVPVYRKEAPMQTLEQRRAALMGWAYSPYRMHDLMTGILGDWAGHQGKNVDLTIYDGLEASPDRLLFDSKPAVTPDTRLLFRQPRTLDFNGRPWLLVCDRDPTASGIGYAPAWTALAGGGALSGLLFWLMLSMINTRVNARRIADQLTEEVRGQAERLYLAASVFTHAWEGIMITAADGTILDVNDAFSRITSYRGDEVLGRNPRILSSGRQGAAFYEAMWRALVEQGQWSGEIWNRRKSGEVYAVMQTISAVRDVQGRIRQYVALFSDVTLMKEQERALEYIAHYDVLTRLPNRVLLADRMRQGMVLAQRYARLLAVAFLDLDGFKAINDHHGHAAGDQLLIAAAAAMKQVLREGDTLARIGGDEFVAVLLDLTDIQASVPMLARLLTAAAQSVPVGERVLQVSASVGVTFYPQTEDIDAEQLLRQADQAMYQAKLAGKNRYHFFDPELDRSVRGHHERLEQIRHALVEREFVLYYQPQVNLRTGTVIGVEALIRWQHPQQGLLLPAAFLPVIDDHPLAVAVGEWVIDSALTQLERWRTIGLEIPISVNVGARQLQQADFVERLHEILAAHPHVRPGDLELEVLETSALADLARVSRIIDRCRGLGVRFALDDFGTGYASLTYLKRLPVAQIKIDQSFIRNMLDDPDDLAILDGVLTLSTAFGRQVIAEGVETVEHGVMLLQLGCELAQGYGIARPMPAAEVPGWTVTWRSDPAWVGLPAVSRDDLPLLFAGAEHRAWMAVVERYLNGEREAPPPDQRQCSFGRWLDGQGLARHGAQPTFQAIEPVHAQLHRLADELVELQAQGQGAAALARLDELHGLSDSVLARLRTLEQEKPRHEDD
ncbi:EAL domain-containing protein [uncultured Lamprocystis sp.]|jgi:diguanylate cyclase (GGDEF)-like protein/PAS domain S-box-containing protein|uniref:EAL domain-containing protein n=1 Tax=uncultured Lamprocystis sp. TaxID=543132 RepID=UPI0025EEB31C|nr:EAL domain-containing protein [uncultured Lamprocystis sp.]